MRRIEQPLDAENDSGIRSYPAFQFTDQLVLLQFCLINDTAITDWSLITSWLSLEVFRAFVLEPAGSNLVELPVEQERVRQVRFSAGSGQTVSLVIAAATSDLLLLPLSVRPAAQAAKVEQRTVLAVVLVMGMIGALCCYNLLLGIQGFGARFFWYAATQASYLGYASLISGLWSYLLEGDVPYFEHAWVLAAFCCNVFSLRFFMSLTGVSRFTGNGTRLLNGLTLAWLVCFVLYVLVPREYVYYWSTTLAAITSLVMLVVCVIWRRHSIYMTLFLVAWCPLLLSNLANILALHGFFPRNEWVTSSLYVGMAIEALLLSLAIAQQFDWLARLARFKQHEDVMHHLDEHLRHEFKTPLSIISTNLELLESMRESGALIAAEGQPNALYRLGLLCRSIDLLFWLRNQQGGSANPRLAPFAARINRIVQRLQPYLYDKPYRYELVDQSNAHSGDDLSRPDSVFDKPLEYVVAELLLNLDCHDCEAVKLLVNRHELRIVLNSTASLSQHRAYFYGNHLFMSVVGKLDLRFTITKRLFRHVQVIQLGF